MNRRCRLLALMLFCALLACSGGEGDEPASTLDKAQRDSVLSESRLPGASTVKGALDIADTAQARADRAESAGDR